MHFPVGETNAQCSRSAHASASSFEASPHYMFEPQVAGRVRQSAPEMKAIFLLRNPVSRAYSHYQHEVRRGVVAMPFEQCIDIEIQQEKDDDRSSSAGTHHHRRSGQRLSYLARGVYIDQLLNWRAHFRAEQMLVLEAERMFNNPGEVFKEVLDFLGLDLWTPPTFGNVYPGRYHTPISPAARDRAMGYFASHNERLFHFLGQRHEWC